MVLDKSTAERADYRVGDSVTIVTSGAQPRLSATLVGIGEFKSGGTVGASLAFFDTRTAQDLYLGGRDEYTDVWVTARGRHEPGGAGPSRAAAPARGPRGGDR